MFVVKINYLVELAEIDKYVQSHRDFLDLHYQSGLFLASGPMMPRTGGIIIALGNDRDKLEQTLEDDPYNQAGIVNYEILEFTAVKSHPELKTLIRSAGDVNL